MNIVSIIPNQLYAGGKLDSTGWAFVAQYIDAVLNVRTYQDKPPFDFTGRKLLWTPILDKVPPNLNWVISLVKLMNVLLDTGHVMYVHDTAGINRLGFILTAYYMQRYGYNRDTALYILRHKKPDLNPNPGYMALLSIYEDYLKRCRCMNGGSNHDSR
jgi:protein-tyrosine phosphatase